MQFFSTLAILAEHVLRLATRNYTDDVASSLTRGLPGSRTSFCRKSNDRYIGMLLDNVRYHWSRRHPLIFRRVLVLSANVTHACDKVNEFYDSPFYSESLTHLAHILFFKLAGCYRVVFASVLSGVWGELI
jgi:hypothetical protein